MSNSTNVLESENATERHGLADTTTERVVDTKRGRDGSGAVRAFVMLILPENDSVQCTYVCIYVIKFSAKMQ